MTIRRQVDFPFAVDYAGIGMLTFVVLLRTASAAVHLDHLVKYKHCARSIGLTRLLLLPSKKRGVTRPGARSHDRAIYTHD